MGALYLKSSSYEFLGHNSRFNNSYWYSLEQESKKSLAYVMNGLNKELPLFGRSPGE